MELIDSSLFCLLQVYMYNDVVGDPLRTQHSVLLLFLTVLIERKTWTFWSALNILVYIKPNIPAIQDKLYVLIVIQRIIFQIYTLLGIQIIYINIEQNLRRYGLGYNGAIY